VIAYASYPSRDSVQSRASDGPIAKAAVAKASASASDGPTSVMLASPLAGRPLRGSMTCAPRSATPEVAMALSAASTTRARPPRRSGLAMPTRHGSPEPGRPPTHWTSPPPLTRWLADPARLRISAQRSTAQPLT
jgi:hypothetical protein